MYKNVKKFSKLSHIVNVKIKKTKKLKKKWGFPVFCFTTKNCMQTSAQSTDPAVVCHSMLRPLNIKSNHYHRIYGCFTPILTPERHKPQAMTNLMNEWQRFRIKLWSTIAIAVHECLQASAICERKHELKF